jgi:hypothetical protein
MLYCLRLNIYPGIEMNRNIYYVIRFDKFLKKIKKYINETDRDILIKVMKNKHRNAWDEHESDPGHESDPEHESDPGHVQSLDPEHEDEQFCEYDDGYEDSHESDNESEYDSESDLLFDNESSSSSDNDNDNESDVEQFNEIKEADLNEIPELEFHGSEIDWASKGINAKITRYLVNKYFDVVSVYIPWYVAQCARGIVFVVISNDETKLLNIIKKLTLKKRHFKRHKSIKSIENYCLSLTS